MDKVLKYTEFQFENYVNDLNRNNVISLHNLLKKELEIEQDTLKRLNTRLKSDNLNSSDYARLAKEVGENKNQIELLQRRLEKCNKKLNNNNNNNISNNNQNYPQLKVANSSPIKHPQNKEIPINTPSLIKNFENKGSHTVRYTPSGTKNNSENNIQSGAIKRNINPTAPVTATRNVETRHSVASINSSTVTSKHRDSNELSAIKLRNVGLPADGKEADQCLYDSTTTNNNNNIQIPLRDQIPNPTNNKMDQRNSIAVTSPRPGKPLINNKNKFYNENFVIRESIQREIKELQLKPVGQRDTSLKNVTKDDITKGKFDFSCEKKLNASSSSTSSVTPSKSMPFLYEAQNAITTSPNTNLTVNSTTEINKQEQQSSLNKSPLINPKEINKFEENKDYLPNWDPRLLLTRLYEIKKLSLDSNSKNSVSIQNDSLKEFIDVFLCFPPGPKYSGRYVRSYVTYSDGRLNIYETNISRTAIEILDMKQATPIYNGNCEIEIHDKKGAVLKLKFNNAVKSEEWMKIFQQVSHQDANHQLIPMYYDESKLHTSKKVLLVDLGSCSVRAGLLKQAPTLPAVYIPHIAAVDKETGDVAAVGIEAVTPELRDTCFITRLLKPDTTLEHNSFTSGAVEMIFKNLCQTLSINPKNYVVMLSVPHNVSESTRTKLADLLLLRMNFKGLSMYGQSLLALLTYNEPTALLVDIGYRTEIVPLTHGRVQSAGIQRTILGGHLAQIALSHLLPIKLESVTDFFLVRYILENNCCTATNYNEAIKNETMLDIDLADLNISNLKNLSLKQCNKYLPVEGLFNPEIYSIDSLSLPKLIYKSINSTSVDCRKELTQSIYISGAASQFPGLIQRLEAEVQKEFPKLTVKLIGTPDRSHYAYLGACKFAASDDLERTTVDRAEWEKSRSLALNKWH